MAGKKCAKTDRAFTPPDKKAVSEIIKLLKEIYPTAKPALNYGSPLELLVATILSAQCTDERVNQVTETLFREYRETADYANADPDRLKAIIRPTGFFNQKGKYIIEMAGKVNADFNGKIPETMEELLTLPGVARKTANCVLGSAFGKAEGIVVDTHVKRVSYRLGLTPNTDPEKIERDLMGIIPRNQWIWFGNALIYLGRRICKARKPDCPGCSLNRICKSAFSTEK